MADLLFNWLNNEIQLSKTVTNFEADFASGYLFGELLYKFNQQANFDEFSPMENISTKMENFQRLEPTLRNLKIKFDSNMIDKIMKQERGQSLRLLYQLKMILEKVFPPTDISIVKKTGKIGDNQPALKIAQQKEKYDNVSHSFFKSRLKSLNKPQKELNIENHLIKFKMEAKRQQSQANESEDMEKSIKEMQKQEMRRAQISKLQRNAGFMEEWFQKGVEDWKVNQQRKKDREQSQLEFDLKETENLKNKTLKKVDDANKEVHEGIAAFENTLRNNGIDPNLKKEVADRVVKESFNEGSAHKKSQKSMKLNSSFVNRPNALGGSTMTKTGAVTLSSTGLKTKAKKTVNEQTRKDRDRRRRKMIQDQAKLMKEMEEERREKEVCERMKRLSKQEEELQYESWRTQQCKNVIVQDRKLRDARFSKRRILDTQSAAFKEEQLLEQMHQQMGREIESMKQRDGDMRIMNKQAHRQRTNEQAQLMFDAIFDIADAAYVHQQKQDSNEIDPRNWHEWLQLFIEQMPIDGSIKKAAENQGLNEEADQQEELDLKESTEQISAAERLNELELVDYLKNCGQWSTKLVSDNKPNIETILLGQNDAQPTGGKGKNAPAKGNQEQIVLEEGDTELDDKPANNFLIGDAIEQILKLNYSARENLKRPKIPHYVSLKLCLIGYAFSGKKTQAEKLKSDYGLEVLMLNDLVEEALKFYSENPNPIERPQKIAELDRSVQEAETMNNSQNIELDQEDKDEEEVKDTSMVQQDLKEESKMDMKSSQASKMDLQKSASKFSKKSKNSNMNESQLMQGSQQAFNKSIKEENQDEGAKKEESTEQEEVKTVNSEVDEDPLPEEDFRQCGEHIKELLEDGQEISDELYVKLFQAKFRMSFPYKSKQDIEEEINTKALRELELTKRAQEIADDVAKDNQEIEEGSQISKKRQKQILQLQAEQQSINNELQSIQQIENNGFVLVDFPANFAQAKLLEAALSGYVPLNECEKIAREKELQDALLLVQPSAKEQPPKVLIKSGLDAVIWFDVSRDECMRRALGRRVNKFNQDENIYHIQDNPPSTQHSPLLENLIPVDYENDCMSSLIDRWLAFDQTSNGLRKWLVQFGEEETQRVLLQKINADQSQEEVNACIADVINQIIELKTQTKIKARDIIKNEILSKEEEERQTQQKQQEADEAKRRLEEAQAKLAELEDNEENQAIKDELNEIIKQNTVPEVVPVNNSSQMDEDLPLPGRDNIDKDFKRILLKLWLDLSRNYKGQMKLVFNKLRSKREEITFTFSTIQDQFLAFLNRYDNKQQILDDFVDHFNKFTDEYPDLREDEQTKEELHQRVDCLSDELWEIIEERKEQAVEERKKIMESGWVENSLNYLTTCSQQLMQAELDKFKQSIQLLHDYYHAIDEKLIPEAPQTYNVDLIQEDVELPQVELLTEGADPTLIDSYSYPRLDKLYERALKSQVVPDVTQQVVGDAKEKKGGKKDAKKGAVEEEKVVEESLYVKEMKEAIKIEKSILRYRLTLIRNWALEKLKDLRIQSLTVYHKLDDWIHVACKAENDSIDEMCIIIKNAIEDETKIQNELRIKFMDFTVDQGILNFIEPPPERLPAMEDVRNDRFNIPQLTSLIDEFEIISKAAKSNQIKNDVVVDLLCRKVQNSRSLHDGSGLPKDWSNLSKQDFIGIVRNLDTENNGCVNWKQLATYMTLIKSSLPTEEQIVYVQDSMLRNQTSQDKISEELFVKTSTWFDSQSKSKDRNYSHPFPRSDIIKQLLFRIHKDQNADSLHIQPFVDLLRSRELRQLHKNAEVYHDLIFTSASQN